MLRLPDGALVLSAGDLAAHLACDHLAQQRLAIARGERARPAPADDAHAELARERGERHEREQLARLSRECGRHVDLSAPAALRTREALETAAARTEAEMRAGAPLIYQGLLFDGRWQGRFDFLRRIEVPSRLGGWSYEVLDTKLARQVKPGVVHQLALYARLVARVQGEACHEAVLVLGDGREERVDLRRYAALHRHVAGRVEAMAAAPARATYPEPVAHCDICPLAVECDARRCADDHLSLVAGARRDQRERLVEAGIATVTALASAPAEVPVARLSAERLDILRNQAALQVASRESGRPRRRHLPPAPARGYARLPAPSPGDVFFDLEGDPYAGPDGGLEYLWGWWSAQAGYECEWAHDAAAEKRALERFVDRVAAIRREHPDMHVHHYAPHERSTLAGLAVTHATRESEVDDLLRAGVLVDLYAVVRQAMQVGEESYSLKRLERHHGFVRLEKSVREGGGSIVAYERWLETGDEALLEAIRAYNEEDCRSTLALRDWLWREMLPEAEAQHDVRFAELREEEPPPAAEPAWLPAIEALTARVTEGLPVEAARDDADQGERRLLAHLLHYHRREAKPEWWGYFERRTKSAEQLEADPEALAWLRPDPSRPPVPVKRSLDHAFTFPPQEFRLSTGQVEDPTTGATYTLVHVGQDHVRLRKGKNGDPPAPVALAAAAPPRTDVQRTAIAEVAEAVLSGSGDHPAARALLRREPPRLRSGRLGEDVDALVGATLGLNRSVLPVQGPPGTGKTYRGARMVVAAIRHGLRVGICAPSHAAIQNLLRAVEAHAAEEGVDPAGVHKGNGDGYESPHGLVEFVDDNAGVTAEHRLVAGTSWLFAREEHRGAFDLLFIDEAGQFALADAVACATAARSLVLLGDPQQLPQVTKARHPHGAGASVLEHLLDGAATIPPDRGVLLTETWRMHPGISAFVSGRSYDGRLRSREGLEVRRVTAPGVLSGAGLRAMAVEHQGASQWSREEAGAIAAACRDLLRGTVTEPGGRTRPLRPRDIMVVAPYNMAVRCILEHVPAGVQVGTVDRFQGQQAPVVFFAMTSSSGEDVPRGLEFLFSANRLNVAISRAQCLAVLVHSPRLLDADCRSLGQMRLLDGVCRLVEMAIPVGRPAGGAARAA